METIGLRQSVENKEKNLDGLLAGLEQKTEKQIEGIENTSMYLSNLSEKQKGYLNEGFLNGKKGLISILEKNNNSKSKIILEKLNLQTT